MPHQIPFTVVFASVTLYGDEVHPVGSDREGRCLVDLEDAFHGVRSVAQRQPQVPREEERHPACELNRHEPTVRGWQSARNCKYPQELVLRLQRPSAIRRVQVLAHQCLIREYLNLPVRCGAPPAPPDFFRRAPIYGEAHNCHSNPMTSALYYTAERIELWVGTEDSWRGGGGAAQNGHSHGGGGGGEAAAEDGDGDRDKDEADTDATPFQYLGFITLSDNQGTGFKSRELKSVSVPPCAGSYLKIRLHRNHSNQYNRYNQVGLIAVNILGDETDAVTASNGKLSSPASDGPGQGQGQGGDNTPYDDLAFQMYVDQDAARIIREMEARKAVAVQDERFEYARKLKAAQAQLHAAGERLARMTLDKRAAIAAEDYGRARTLKATIDELRDRLYKELAVDDLLEKNGPVARNDETPDEEAVDGPASAPAVCRAVPDVASEQREQALPLPPSSPLHCMVHRSTASPSPTTTRPTTSARTSGLPRPVVNPPAKEAPPALRGGGALGSAQRRRLKSAPATPVSALGSAAHSQAHAAGGGSGASTGAAGSCTPTARSSYEAYEERALPALRHGGGAHPDQEHSERPRSKLNERERKQAALPISVFGVEMVEKFYSKHFADKEEGLRRLRSELCDEGRPTPQPNKKARAAIFLLHRALRDKVFSVYSLAAEVIRLFFTHFVPDRVSPAEVGRSVDRLLPELLLKSGDSTPRIHNMAVHTILSIADVEQVRSLNVIPATLTRPLQAATHPRLALSRLEMVEQLILSHGISQPGTGGARGSSTAGAGAGASRDKPGAGREGSGMTCRTLAELGAQGLQHPAEAVRKVAERILVLVYRVNPRLVRKQLPPDDDITRRNLLYRQLFTDFDSIDVQRKREMQERQRGESSGSGSPAPRPPAGWVPPSSMSASWHQGQGGGLTGLPTAATLSPAPSPRPGLRRHAAAMSSSMSASMCASWANGSTAKSGSSSSSGASSLASPTEATPQPPIARRGADGDGDVKACDFCGAVSESFASDEGLNSHYWRACPLLTRCNECQQVVEIACLATHLTEECELRALYRRCGGCTEAVPLQRMQLHVSSCVPLGAQCRRCPLCHSDVRDTDAAWRSHLMGPTAKLCTAHPRLKYARAVRAPAPAPAPVAPGMAP
ncbi:Centrosomal protein of 104 kDa [Frankliniella fusca]|uniref:Centrosomal protein of 104 kDa n=1 Tax=Frankliniella fusca TaxID=407009 RepID=A0AAE1LDZ2_9NEOP|nr:Centrosomal protein of 104 kDa [Frankliniella fusca]